MHPLFFSVLGRVDFSLGCSTKMTQYHDNKFPVVRVIKIKVTYEVTLLPGCVTNLPTLLQLPGTQQ